MLNSLDLSLKENQIVCLEYSDNHLYGEVIQLIYTRQLCWFRPLCLVIADHEKSFQEFSYIEESLKSEGKPEEYSSLLRQKVGDCTRKGIDKITLIDLRSGSDLLWPESLFRPALDTEIIHLLPQLRDINNCSGDKKITQMYLNKFVCLFWQANQDKF